MKNIYNKGKYRSHEYGKISAYLKRRGNKLWRRTAAKEIDIALNDAFSVKPVKRKKKRSIKVKITEFHYTGWTFTYYKSYATMRDMKNAVSRNCVVKYTVLYK